MPLVRMNPIYDMTQPAPLPVLTGNVQMNALSSTGSPAVVNAGEIFPATAKTGFVDARQLQPMPDPTEDDADPTDPASFNLALQQNALQAAMAEDGNYGQVPPGCTYHIQIYGLPWRMNPNPPYSLGQKDYAGNAFCGTLYADYTDTVFPTFTTDTNLGEEGGNPVPNPFNLTTMHAAGPNLQYSNPCARNTWDFLVPVIVGYNCGPQGGGFFRPMAMTAPPPVSLIPGIPIPAVPKANTPVINSGVVQTAAPGQAGSITFQKQLDGSLTPTVSMPNCTCADGCNPTIGQGNVTHNNALPSSATVRSTGTCSYVIDFNLPNTGEAMVPIQVTVPITDANTGVESIQTLQVMVPGDGTNDFGAAFMLLLAQILELRYGISPGVPNVQSDTISGQ